MFVFVWFSWWWWWWLLVCWTLSGSLFLFFISSAGCCCCFHHLFSNCFCFRYPEALINILCLRSCLIQIRCGYCRKKATAKAKRRWETVVVLGHLLSFSPPPSVIRTDHSGWDPLRLLISSFIHSEFRWSFSFPYYSFPYFLSWNNWRAH